MKTIAIPESEYLQLQQTIVELKARLTVLSELETLLPWLKKAAFQNLPEKRENGPAGKKKLPIIKFERSGTPAPLEFGGGKHMITYMADDFTAPLDDFEEYMQ